MERQTCGKHCAREAGNFTARLLCNVVAARAPIELTTLVILGNNVNILRLQRNSLNYSNFVR